MTRSDPESAVLARYAASAKAAALARCCSVPYASRYLEALPAELLEKDFGCGGGKVCWIAARSEQRWRTVQGIEFRSLTVRALKADETRRRQLPQAPSSCGPAASGCC